MTCPLRKRHEVIQIRASGGISVMRERTERFFPKFAGFRFALLSVFILFSLVGAACAAQKYHIGIVTSTVSQSEDSARGAEFIMAKYKSTSDGGIVKYITYPDNFSAEMETTISQIASMADDPKMKVVVATQIGRASCRERV